MKWNDIFVTDSQDELRGLHGFLRANHAGMALAGRVRVGGVNYRIRCYCCDSLHGDRWAVKLEPEARKERSA